MVVITLINISILFVSFILLIKSADSLISAGSIIGERFKISKFVIGLLIIGIGTSLPELITGLVSVFTSTYNAPSFVLGTIIGSNIANMLLVFGIFLILAKKINLEKENGNIILLLFSTLLLGISIYLGNINIYFGLLFIIFFIIFLYISIKYQKKEVIEEEVNEVKDEKFEKVNNFYLYSIFLLSLIIINIGARGVVYSIENLGLILGLSVQFLTLTTVAFATSLPEIIVTISSVKKGNLSMGIGNIIGSNISNILLIVGLSSITGILVNNPLKFSNVEFLASFIILLIVTIIFSLLVQKDKLYKRHGIILLLLYCIYIYLIF